MSTRAEGNVIDYTPATGVAAGEAVVVGAIVGVASSPIAANALGSLNVRGVFSVDKPTGAGTAIAQGAKVSLFNGLAVTGATGTAMGYAAKAATTTDNSVDVLLVPGA
jgi:predicted RecA/RadA family phage recombinase